MGRKFILVLYHIGVIFERNCGETHGRCQAKYYFFFLARSIMVGRAIRTRANKIIAKKIYKRIVSVIIPHLLIQRLNIQNNIVTNPPNSTLVESYLSSAAGSTTEARLISAISDAMSDNFSNCRLLNFGK